MSNPDCVDANVCFAVDVDHELRVERKNYVIEAARDSLGVESPRGIPLARVIIVRLTPVCDVIPRCWLRSVVNRVWYQTRNIKPCLPISPLPGVGLGLEVTVRVGVSVGVRVRLRV